MHHKGHHFGSQPPSLPTIPASWGHRPRGRSTSATTRTASWGLYESSMRRAARAEAASKSMCCAEASEKSLYPWNPPLCRTFHSMEWDYRCIIMSWQQRRSWYYVLHVRSLMTCLQAASDSLRRWVRSGAVRLWSYCLATTSETLSSKHFVSKLCQLRRPWNAASNFWNWISRSLSSGSSLLLKKCLSPSPTHWPTNLTAWLPHSNHELTAHWYVLLMYTHYFLTSLAIPHFVVALLRCR